MISVRVGAADSVTSDRRFRLLGRR